MPTEPEASISIFVEDDLAQLLDDEVGRGIGRELVGVQDSVDSPDGPGGAEAAAGANRRRNYGRKRGLAPDPTGRAAPDGPPPSTR